MSFPFVTRPAAAEEIETAYRWYEKEREGLGSEFLEALEKMVKTIAENPERFPTIRKDIRRAVLLVVTHPFHPLTGQRLPPLRCISLDPRMRPPWKLSLTSGDLNLGN